MSPITPLPTSNTVWADLNVGDTAAIKRTCRASDLVLFAHVSGNVNPATLADSALDETPASAEDRVIATAPSMWVGSLVSAVLGNVLPGPGTLYRSQDLRFHRRVHVGDLLTIQVTCTAKGEAPLATFDARITNEAGDVVCEGLAEVEVPQHKLAISKRELPSIIVGDKDHFAPLLERAKTLPPMRVAVVCPEDENSLGGAVLAQHQGLIVPVLIGDPGRIQAAADKLGVNVSGWQLLAESDSHAAATLAVKLAREGKVDSLMKGALHSDELLSAVVHREHGLRTHRRLSHVFVMDVPTLDHLLFISDAAINIAPDLMAKVDITQSAIDVARSCGVGHPRVGVLSALETINPAIPSTLDAAIISKMAERGQIKGATVDGPLAMDNAIDLGAAHAKGIRSLVAGQADVLIVPNLEAGNMLAKELTFVVRAEAAGLVVGARVPIMLTSRADNDRARVTSCALAQLHQYWQRHGRAYLGDTAPAGGDAQ